MLNVGLIGYGAIGQDIASYFQDYLKGARLKGILVRSPDKLRNLSQEEWMITHQPDEFFANKYDVIIEAAGHHALETYGVQALSTGAHLIIVSVGALRDGHLLQLLKETANSNQSKLIIPSSAIGGLDRITAASIGRLDSVTLTTRKPPQAWKGTFVEDKIDLAALVEPVCVFEGNANESARLFPESVNVSAALSLAGQGFNETKVKVYADPTIEKNKHEVRAVGNFGSITLEVQNTPFPENPKSSYIVSMSVIKALENLFSPIVIGI
ncbi:aspartate dehydrogenase [Fictibacillus solisalsi]|uniref:L-aspartate dehydrogenase n=1 Tax=Fictibacillus solisalsi TaxID=459525 RepID=A0A1G9TS13_9BACL|nr:aspartate dehydrogenase [Fictibacillus solisalsi]SDM50510.1 aspartate dehydrogenase [Fictibacillus solisalsi]